MVTVAAGGVSPCGDNLRCEKVGSLKLAFIPKSQRILPNVSLQWQWANRQLAKLLLCYLKWLISLTDKVTWFQLCALIFRFRFFFKSGSCAEYLVSCFSLWLALLASDRAWAGITNLHATESNFFFFFFFVLSRGATSSLHLDNIEF